MSEPYLSKYEFYSLRDQPAKSVVERLFLLKVILVINHCGFHCPLKLLNNELFPNYGIFVYVYFDKYIVKLFHS